MDEQTKALTAAWNEARRHARAEWTEQSDRDAIERLITAGDTLLAALAAPWPRMDAVQALVKKWREEALKISGPVGGSAYADELHFCADELEAALAAPRPSGERQPADLVALVTEYQNRRTAYNQNRDDLSFQRVQEALDAIIAWRPSPPGERPAIERCLACGGPHLACECCTTPGWRRS